MVNENCERRFLCRSQLEDMRDYGCVRWFCLLAESRAYNSACKLTYIYIVPPNVMMVYNSNHWDMQVRAQSGNWT